MATSKTVEAPCSFVETGSSVKNHDQILDVFTEGVTGAKNEKQSSAFVKEHLKEKTAKVNIFFGKIKNAKKYWKGL